MNLSEKDLKMYLGRRANDSFERMYIFFQNHSGVTHLSPLPPAIAMADYFEEMGWRPLESGEQPNHLLHMARFLIDFGMYEDNFSGEWPRLPPPASKEAVKNLQEVTIDSESKDCPICLKKFKMGDKGTRMPCQHVFHAQCILTWLDKTNSCPFCRHELPTDDEGYEAFKKEKKRAEQRKEDMEMLHNSMFS